MTTPESCPNCGGRGYTTETRRVRGYGALHNERVRNYRGGPRPNLRTDYNESYRERCPLCDGGRRWQEDE
ncbi:MAG TPA: hypothetical protein VGJ60_07320 [Chloroflexota bacterium]|jgi:hypothetical protein